jgi:hypothetical protein
MTDLKELEEFLSKPENAEAFKSFVKPLGFETPDDISGLKAKNTELILKNKKIQENYENQKKILDDIDLEEYHTLRDKASSNPKDTDIQRKLKKFEEDNRKISDAMSALENEYHGTLKSAEIEKALAPFDDKYRELLVSAFQNKSRVEILDGKRSVIIDDGDGLGLPASEYFSKFAQSEKGKAYLKTPVNAGAQSRSVNSQGAGKQTILRKQFDAITDPKEKVAIGKTHTVIDQ